MPCSHTSDLSKDRAIAIYCILKGLTIDVGKVIHSNIVHLARRSAVSTLWFPCLITGLCKKAGVPLAAGDIPKKLKNHIDGNVLAKLIEFDGDDVPAPAPTRLPGPPRSQASRIDQLWDYTRTRMDHHDFYARMSTLRMEEHNQVLHTNEQVIARHLGIPDSDIVRVGASRFDAEGYYLDDSGMRTGYFCAESGAGSSHPGAEEEGDDVAASEEEDSDEE